MLYVARFLTTPHLADGRTPCVILFSRTFLPAIFTADNRASLLLTSLARGLLVGFCEELGCMGLPSPGCGSRTAFCPPG